MKGTLDENTAVAKMLDLLSNRYKCSYQQTGNKFFIITNNGNDGGDVHSNGDYDFGAGHVNFMRQTEEEIVTILDEAGLSPEV
ncbi:MAG: hypothetical protein HDS66_01115 [Bacteroidales bacterium]|nr:hypothetical protein [Bacteroidales bacterium]